MKFILAFFAGMAVLLLVVLLFSFLKTNPDFLQQTVKQAGDGFALGQLFSSGETFNILSFLKTLGLIAVVGCVLAISLKRLAFLLPKESENHHEK